MHYVIRPTNNVLKTVINDLGNLHPDMSWDVSISKHNKSKTRQQEKYFHNIIDIILLHQSGRIDEDEKKKLKRDIAWRAGITDFYVKPDTGEVIKFPKETKSLTVEEYGVMITAAQLICLRLELSYPEPD